MNEIELSDEEISTLKKAYRRPVAGVVLDTIISFEKSLQAPEEKAPEEITEENLFTEPRTYGEYLKYFKAQEAVKMAKEEEPVEEQIPMAEEEPLEEAESVDEELAPALEEELVEEQASEADV